MIDAVPIRVRQITYWTSDEDRDRHMAGGGRGLMWLGDPLPIRSATYLHDACLTFPHPDVISRLLQLHPVALLISSCSDDEFPLEAVLQNVHASDHAKALVVAETNLHFLALLELLMHETFFQLAEARTLMHERDPTVDLSGDSYALAQSFRSDVVGPRGEAFRQSVLGIKGLQGMLRSGKLDGCITALCRMNKAGRANLRRSGTKRGQLQILEAAEGDLNGLFIHLRANRSLFCIDS
jgi:hypothetical protein